MINNIKLVLLILILSCSLFAQSNSELEKLISIAQENNLTIKQIEHSIEAAKIKIAESKSTNFPTASINAGYSYMGPLSKMTLSLPTMNKEIELNNASNYSANITLNYVLFDWFRDQTNIEISEKEVGNSQINLESAQINLQYQIAQIYYSILFFNEAIKVYETNKKSLETKMDLAQKKFENGLATNLDVLNVKVQISSVKNKIIEANNSIVQLKLSLNRLLNRELSTEIQLSSKLEMSENTFDNKDVFNQALKYRTELKQIMLDNELFEKKIYLTKSVLRPTLSLTGQWGYKNGIMPDKNKLQSNYLAGINLSFPIFDGFKNSTQIEQMEIAQNNNQLKLNDTKLQIESEIRQNISSYYSNKEKLLNENDKVSQSQEALATAEQNYENNLSSIVELLDAQSNFQSANLGLIQAKYNCILSELSINKSLSKKILQ